MAQQSHRAVDDEDRFYKPLLVVNDWVPFYDRQVVVYNHDLSRKYERSVCAGYVYEQVFNKINVFGYISTIQQ